MIKYKNDEECNVLRYLLNKEDSKESNKQIGNTSTISKSENIKMGNYPNPFNPSTTIAYNIPKDGHVKLAVYDLLGKEIKMLVNENKSTGKYSVQFNGNNLASGTYFYHLTVTPSDGSKQIVIQKSLQLLK